MGFSPIETVRRVDVKFVPLRYGICGDGQRKEYIQFRIAAGVYKRLKPGPPKFWRLDIDEVAKRGLLRVLLNDDGDPATRNNRPSNDEANGHAKVAEWRYTESFQALFPREPGELANVAVTSLGIEFDLPGKKKK